MGANFWQRPSRYFWLTLGVLLLALMVRLYQFGAIPASLYWDEVAILADAKMIVATGSDLHGLPWHQAIFTSYGDMKLPVYIWSTALSVWLLGVSEIAVRLPSLVAGMGSVVVIGLLTRNLLRIFAALSKPARKLTSSQSWQISLVVMLVVALSPWSIIFSRIGFEGHLGQFLLTTSIWLLSLSFVRGQSAGRSILLLPCFWLSIGLGALATYTYFSVLYVWPLVWGAAFFLMSWQTLRLETLLPKTLSIFLLKTVGIGLTAGFAFWLLLTPLLNSPLYQEMINFRLSADSVLNSTDHALESNKLRDQAGNDTIDRIFYHRDLLLTRDVLRGVSQNLSLTTLFVSGDPQLRHGTSLHGYFVLPLIIAFAAGLIWLFAKLWPLGLLLVGWSLVGVVPASLPLELPHLLRSLGALSALSIIVGIGLWWMISSGLEMIKQKDLSARLTVVATSFYLLICAISTAAFLHYYFVNYPVVSARAWQEGYTQLADRLLSEQYQDSDIYIHPFDDRFFLWWLVNNHVSPAQIEAVNWEGHQITSIKNLHYGQFDWAELETLEKPFVIAGPRESLEVNLRAQELRPSSTEIIRVPDPAQDFVIYYF